ncbi:MAG: hypothetical protein HY721_26660 [Planctomycetes bacterium]|nr:hypothetical protein [Planctomycetota bacterium]
MAKASAMLREVYETMGSLENEVARLKRRSHWTLLVALVILVGTLFPETVWLLRYVVLGVAGCIALLLLAATVMTIRALWLEHRLRREVGRFEDPTQDPDAVDPAPGPAA